METITDELRVEVFAFLDDLRDSGITNMFGAAPYIMQEFNLNRSDAIKLLTEWMKSYDSK